MNILTKEDQEGAVVISFNKILFFVCLGALTCSCFTGNKETSLREIYSQSPENWPPPHIDEGVEFRELGLLPEMTYPEANPYTKEKYELGKILFFDPGLSVSGQISCASCHDPELGWGDGRSRAIGHNRQVGTRNAMTLINSGYFTEMFWDGRANTLEGQALLPIQDHLEMNMPFQILIKNIKKSEDYKAMFEETFGDNRITGLRVAQAISTFERSITSRESRFDKFLKGNTEAMSDSEIKGLHLFRTKGRCTNCHHGPLFSDQKYHNDGFTDFGRMTEDLGRFLVTGDTSDVGAFRTPGLRDVTFTGPWMHHGAFRSLREIMDVYNLGNPQPVPKKVAHLPLRPHSSPLLKPLDLTDDEKEAIIDFLGSISTRPINILPPRNIPTY